MGAGLFNSNHDLKNSNHSVEFQVQTVVFEMLIFSLEDPYPPPSEIPEEDGEKNSNETQGMPPRKEPYSRRPPKAEMLPGPFSFKLESLKTTV